MPHSLFALRNIRLLMIVVLFGFCSLLRAQNAGQSSAPTPAPSPEQSNAAKSDTSQPPSAQVPANNSEVSSQDSPPTFKVRVNLVLVRVVVRDAQGKVVPNLRKEDFQLFDNRKPQVITTFSVETPESQALKAATSPTPAEDGANASNSGEPVTSAAKLPQRFVALLFDDAHLTMQDAAFVRDAGTRFFSSLAPSDRVGVFTSSGQFTQMFTADHDALQKSLLSIVPRSMLHATGAHDCPDVSYYQADLIENRHDAQALSAAVEDAVQCAFGGDESKAQLAIPMASSAASRALSLGDTETQNAFRHVEDIMRKLAQMPGQRIMVFVSPGFILSTLRSESSDLVDRANRASIVINTIDARGLYTPQILGDIADPQQDSAKTSSLKAGYRLGAEQAQDEILEQLAYGTGGTYFHNRNDIDEGLRQAGAAPAISYVLGFSPQNMKVDGHFHGLKVALTNKQQKYSLQTRNGYYAPKTIADPGQAAKLEIQEAIFSQEELHDVPVDLQTQFFKKDAANARLSVLTHFDLKSIHFRKVEGRNNDNLTIATAIFDENGNFITGGEKTVQMRLLDTTYNRLSRSGLTLKSSYDVKPGSYMVRLVVRDGEGSQMAARNGAVIIPY
jgi:VWFA-related protein